MEALIAILIVSLSATGLAVGLLLGRKPPRMGCDGLACVDGGGCCGGCGSHGEDGR
jgi:hypothetical protein